MSSDELAQRLASYNVTWNQPGETANDSMPLGNGTVGINAWIEASTGDLLMYLARNDSFDENLRLLKIGRVRVAFSRPLAVQGQSFVHELRLLQSEMVVTCGQGREQVTVHVWVDAHRPVVHVKVESIQAIEFRATVEIWRDRQRELNAGPVGIHQGEIAVSDPYCRGFDGSESGQPTIEYPDVIAPRTAERIAWYHHNQHSPYEDSLKLQGLGDWNEKPGDPIFNRIFGGAMFGPEVIAIDDRTVASRQARTSQHLMIAVLTLHPSSPTQWVDAIDQLIAQSRSIDTAKARAEHQQWWSEFWNRSWIFARGTPEAEQVTRAYVLQRFVTACAGRGPLPVKFNGSIFNVDGRDENGAYSADFRRWGGAFWFQNTRLIYWPMLAAGDFEMMHPLFDMYGFALPLARERTRRYYGHDGAFFSETMYYWGAYHNGDYGWNRSGHRDGFVINSYIRYYWSGGIELSVMLLDYLSYTGDKAWAQRVALPMVRAIVRFFEQHYPRDEQGRLRIEPAMALETWQDATNPTPEIAGLKYLLNRLMQLDDELVSDADRSAWRRLHAELPPVPLIEKNGHLAIAPAERFEDKKNCENPELYAVFPYRLWGVGQPDLELARHTFATREFKQNCGWCQDSFQAALLGLAEEAGRMVHERAIRKHEASRFPAFWGPNFDWMPDQDHGNTILLTLQMMALQSDDANLHVLPAWPAQWDVDFKLHAASGAVVTASARDGKLVQLNVSPDTQQKIQVRLNSSIQS